MLEPEISDFIRRGERMYPEGATDLTPTEQRRLYDQFCAATNPPRPAKVESADSRILGTAGVDIPVRSYRSTRQRRPGCVLYLHGGGFVLGGLDSHDFIAAHLADRTGLAVVAAAYRLAPEHPYPAARDDARAVLAALQSDPGTLGLDPGPLFVGGDSAGANLAASLALHNRDRAGPPLAGQFLIYPLLAAQPTPPASVSEANAPLLTLQDVLRYHFYYHGEELPETDPYAFPLAARDLTQLPPALLMPVEHDPLRDDGVEYYARLRAAGVEAELTVGTGLVHGCLRALGTSPGVEALLSRLCGWLVEHANKLLQVRDAP